MRAKRVEYHQGATEDVKRAVAWYRKRSPKAALDFIEELHRAADTIREGAERWPIGNNNSRRFLLWRFLLWRFPFAIIIFRTRIGSHGLGRRPWQQTTGILVASPLMRRSKNENERNEE
jgi:plasmid stabilization system protein ParE